MSKEEKLRLTCPPGLHYRKEDCLSGHTSVVERPDSPEAHLFFTADMPFYIYLSTWGQLVICFLENDLHLSSFKQPALPVAGRRWTGVAYQRFLIDLHLWYLFLSLDFFNVCQQTSQKTPFHPVFTWLVWPQFAAFHLSSEKYKSGDCKGHVQQIPIIWSNKYRFWQTWNASTWVS